LVLSGLEGRTRARLARGGVEDGERVRTFEDLDRAMEWCEARLIEEAGILPHATTSLLERLVHQMGAQVEDLLPHLERVEVPEGHEVIRQGDPAGDVFFLESGRLTAELRQDDGDVIRLRSMGPGTVVGEVAMYLGTPRTASVVADRPSVLYRLSGEKLTGLERSDPAAAAAVHRLFARLLSDRLSDTLGSMSALMD
jgi:SulP family sulfate permease